MRTEKMRADQGNIEHVRMKISRLFAQCLCEMENTVAVAGLTMKDAGVDVERYSVCSDTCVVELKLQLEDLMLHPIRR